MANRFEKARYVVVCPIKLLLSENTFIQPEKHDILKLNIRIKATKRLREGWRSHFLKQITRSSDLLPSTNTPLPVAYRYKY